MKIIRKGEHFKKKANQDWFHGMVWQELIMDCPNPARVKILKVSFEPGSRTAWHTHPLGQTLHVIEGAGLIAYRGSKPVRIKLGDTVWIPPGKEHWHGASIDSRLVHFAIQEALSGSTANWLEQVTETDYSL